MMFALCRVVLLLLFLVESPAASTDIRRLKKSKDGVDGGGKKSKKSKKGKKKVGDVVVEAKICNRMDPMCGLTATEAQERYLSTFEELKEKLQNIKEESRIPIRVGPLIKNGNNNGLLDIDVKLKNENGLCDNGVNCEVCGDANMDPTIREAIICSVTNDVHGFPLRGNSDPSKIGFSSFWRELMAVELGNMHDPDAKKMFVVTQSHGSEAAGTEGALAVLKTLTQKKEKWTKKVLRELHIVIVLRANVDGGSPDGTNLGENYPLYLSGDKSIFDEDNSKAFVRDNLDPLAGGAMGDVDGNPLSEPEFFGTVGRGYNLNRYIYTKFDGAIRPVECQALVGALHAFMPHAVFDMHGDGSKNTCDLDVSTLQPNSLLVLPGAECLPPAPPVPTITTAREWMVEGSVFNGNEGQGELERLSQKISAEIANSLDPKLVGSIVRFSQIQQGTGVENDATLGRGGANLGAVMLGCEVSNYDIHVRPSVQGIVLNSDGEPVPNINLDTALIEPCYLEDNICIQENFLEQALIHSANFLDGDFDDPDNGGFCDLPIQINYPGQLLASYGWQDESMDEPINVPAGRFGVPSEIDGLCPTDPDYVA